MAHAKYGRGEYKLFTQFSVPGGIRSHVANKEAGVIFVYLPPDANTLLLVSEAKKAWRNEGDPN